MSSKMDYEDDPELDFLLEQGFEEEGEEPYEEEPYIETAVLSELEQARRQNPRFLAMRAAQERKNEEELYLARQQALVQNRLEMLCEHVRKDYDELRTYLEKHVNVTLPNFETRERFYARISSLVHDIIKKKQEIEETDPTWKNCDPIFGEIFNEIISMLLETINSMPGLNSGNLARRFKTLFAALEPYTYVIPDVEVENIDLDTIVGLIQVLSEENPNPNIVKTQLINMGFDPQHIDLAYEVFNL